MRAEPFQDDPRIAHLAAIATVSAMRARIEREFASQQAAETRCDEIHAASPASAADNIIPGLSVLLGFKRSAHARDLEYSEAKYDGR